VADDVQPAMLANGGSPATLRAAIRDLLGDFGPEYPAGEEYLRRLEALAIIQAGQAELRKNPESDMPGFRPCAEHQVREAKYQALRNREQNRRQALSDGRKVFDPDIGVAR